MQKLTMSVTEVMVMDTAASDNVLASLSGTSMVTGVRLQAANMTNVSSIPIPENNFEKILKSKINKFVWKRAIKYVWFENFFGTVYLNPAWALIVGVLRAFEHLQFKRTIYIVTLLRIETEILRTDLYTWV